MADLMSQMTQERRDSPRQKSFLQGRVIFNQRRSSIDCVVRELSDNGARLKFATPPAVPEVFELHVPNKDETFRAQIVWHDGTDMGVSLTAIEGSSHAPNVLEERVAKLERELAALKRRFEEIAG
jgi:hypothetical protein